MCLLIAQKQNAKTLESSVLNTAFQNNSDGVGFSFIENNALKVLKYRDFDTFFDSYSRYHKKLSKSSCFIIHFRIGTHGTSNGVYNVHPFYVNKNLVFAHNGMIHKVDNCNKRSDTRVFNDTILKSLNSRMIIENNAVHKLISEYIGQSKLVFLRSDNSLKIINSHMGHWSGKTWFSNNSYKNGVCDFGGITKSNNYTFDFNSKYNDTKQTKYQASKCEHCNVYVTKRHKNSLTNGWVCGTCYNVLNADF